MTASSLTQTQQLKQQLERRFAELRDQVREELLSSEDEHYIQLAGRVHDSGDEAVGDLLSDINLAVIDQHIKEIQDIERALMRMREGTYAICAECGDDIEYERLRAHPTAKRCYACQSQHEKTHSQPGHSGL